MFAFLFLHIDVGGGLEGGLTDVAIEVLHVLLTYLLYTPQKEVGIGEDQKQAFLTTLRKGRNIINCNKYEDVIL